MKVQICLFAMFLLGISCAPLPEEAIDTSPVQQQEQKVTEQLLLEESNTKETRKEQSEATELKPQLRSVPEEAIDKTKESAEKLAEEKIEEPKALPVEEKKIEEMKIEEPKALPIEEKKEVQNVELKSTILTAKVEEKIAEPAVAAAKSVEVEKDRVEAESNQAVQLKSVSLEETSKNELESNSKKSNEQVKENIDDKLPKIESGKDGQNVLDAETKREEKKVEEKEEKNSKEITNESIEEKSIEKDEAVATNESKKESAELDESKE